LQHGIAALHMFNEAYSLCLPSVSARKASPILSPMHMIKYIFQRHGRGLFSAASKFIGSLQFSCDWDFLPLLDAAA
jgi:hypothetical protein